MQSDMKAEELMIGDWVKFPIGIEKIIDLPYIEGRGICASFSASATLFPVEIDKLNPIPITPEILEKNGFEKLGYEGWEFDSEEETRRDCPNYQIIWRRDYPSPHNTNLKITSFIAGIGNFRSFDIKFVHELQHALRLCGIDKEIVI